jgi:hypothetical protein
MSRHRSGRVGTLKRRIRAIASPGTAIPKPAARSAFAVKSDGEARYVSWAGTKLKPHVGKPALVLLIDAMP